MADDDGGPFLRRQGVSRDADVIIERGQRQLYRGEVFPVIDCARRFTESL
jgi:hypothetical protein